MYEIEAGVDHDRLLRDYDQILSELGWPAIRATCEDAFFVGAARWTNGYKRSVGVRVHEANLGG